MCVEVSYALKSGGALTAVGGESGEFWGRSSRWMLPIAEMVQRIGSGRWKFFVERPDQNERVAVIIATRDGTRFIKTVRDGEVPNNLLELPEPPSVSAQLKTDIQRLGALLANPWADLTASELEEQKALVATYEPKLPAALPGASQPVLHAVFAAPGGSVRSAICSTP